MCPFECITVIMFFSVLDVDHKCCFIGGLVQVGGCEYNCVQRLGSTGVVSVLIGTHVGGVSIVSMPRISRNHSWSSAGIVAMAQVRLSVGSGSSVRVLCRCAAASDANDSSSPR